MIIHVGSKNPVKIAAVEETIKDYNIFTNPEIKSFDTNSGVSKQPITLHEVLKGASTRAINSFNNCSYSFGLESGLMETPFTKTGYLDICGCAIYDGSKTAIGTSGGLEFPIKVIELITNEGLDVNEATFRSGLTNNPKIGSSSGLLNLLTNKRIDRKEFTKQAIRMALVQLEHPELY